jgi:hypothetical protein
MSDTDLYKTLANKETWSIEEVLALLCGPSDPSAIIRGETHQPIGEHLEAAANQGRFGMLAGPEPYKFLWDMDRFRDSLEPLDTITKFEAHYLKYLDWIEDEDILDKIKLDDERKKKILGLLGTLSNKKPAVSPVVVDLDYQRLAEEDLWSLTDLRFVLFGETYSSRYRPNLYHKYDARTETLMQKVDRVIQDAALVGRHLEVHEVSNRPPLIDSDREIQADQDLGEFGYFGIYDTNEIGSRSTRYYNSPDLFNLLTLKGFPVPKGLAVALDQNKTKPALELLKELKENILYLTVHGENPPNTQVDRIDQKSKIEFKDGVANDLFEKEGDFWTVSIKGQKASGLKHLIGMSYISHLYRNTGKEIHVIPLDQMVHNVPAPVDHLDSQTEINTIQIDGRYVQRDIAIEDFKNADNTNISGSNKAENSLCKKDLRLLTAEKKILEQKLHKAQYSSNFKEVEAIESELEVYTKGLNAVSFNGRGIPDEPEIERARQRIQRVIKDAIGNINKQNPTLGKLLKDCIKTGEFCSFRQ